jgi:hypothetical protein
MFEPKLKEQRQGNFKLELDVRKGFATAVRNNQTRLAFEYAVELIDNLIEYVESLEARLADSESKQRPATKKAAATADSADDQ